MNRTHERNNACDIDTDIDNREFITQKKKKQCSFDTTPVEFQRNVILLYTNSFTYKYNSKIG